MRTRAIVLGALLLAGCVSDNFTPPKISPALVAQSDHASAQQLAAGRTTFVSRCLECHTLPPIKKYSPAQWPGLVNQMSARANLNSDQKAAVIAYLRAAASTNR